jgi:hypothetical protein
MKRIEFTKMGFFHYLVGFVLLLTTYFLCLYYDSSKIHPLKSSGAGIKDGKKFNLIPGDILVRPNLSWMPGSSRVEGGRKFGHAGIVVQGAEGNSIEEVMSKSVIVEAHKFDRSAMKFIFDSSKYVCASIAIIAFGEKFKGNRYRLRYVLPEKQVETMIKFLFRQTGTGQYNLFSFRSDLIPYVCGQSQNPTALHAKWNCSSFVWFTFFALTGTDLDANQGNLIYPNDLIASPLFDSPDGRIRF